jgi:pheophorbide a oxygenase
MLNLQPTPTQPHQTKPTQERILYSRGDATAWRKQYYLASSADAAVLSWRRWIDEFGSALPVLPKSAADIPPLLPRAAIFDRYNQHTKHCPHCSGALRNINVAIGVLAVLGVVAAAAAVVAAAGGAALGGALAAGPLAVAGAGALKAAGAKLVVGGAAVAAVAGLVVAGLLKFRQLFLVVDYVHADMH